jgi:hypothetical protein
MENDFDWALRAIEDPNTRMAVIDVADRMFLIKKWFEEYKISYTAADLVAAANLVLAREGRRGKRELGG